jgi:hypothetical protein
MSKTLLITIFLSFLISCTQEKGSDKAVRVENSGIFNPISIQINGKEARDNIDLGEYVTASEKLLLKVKIKNNTKYPMTNIDVVFINRVTKIYDYYSSGESEAVYPGEDGSCNRVLAAGDSCFINLSFFASKSGPYSQQISITYKNLVEPDDRNFNLSLLAGQPASLIFDDGSTNNYYFGEKVGTALKPVLERSEVVTFERDLILVNKGELTARQIKLDLPFGCQSYLDGFTGDLKSYSQTGFSEINFCDAWLLTHNCPENLKPNEQCEMKLSFTPTNQDQAWGFDDVLAEVYFSSKINVKYENTPYADNASLNGNFETYSTTIGARFETTKRDVTFEEEVVVGNFVMDIFQLKNNGYRAGILKQLVLTNNGGDGVAKAICIRTSSLSGLMECFDETLSTKLTLEQLPFILSERDNCFSIDGETSEAIQIDQGCIIDLRFQPSLEYKEKKNFNYKLSVVYDSRWKGNETILEKNLFDIISKSLHAGVLKIASVEFDARQLTLNDGLEADGIDSFVDLKRLALLSPGYETFRSVKIVFQNIGGAPINAYSAFSGIVGGEMGRTELSKVFDVTVGNYATKYFKDIKIDQNNCGNLGVIIGDISGVAGAKCTIEMQFAPISMSTTAMQNQTMFDRLDTSDPLKIFSMTYHDGSNFSDINIEGITSDISAANDAAYKNLSVGIKAQLIEKGFLADYSELDSRVAGGIVRDNTAYKTLLFRNIGTGPISWIPYIGEQLEHEDSITTDEGVVRVTVSNPAAYGADYDCNDVFDFEGYTTDPSVASARLTSKQKLSKLETCVLRIKFDETPNYYSHANGDVARSDLQRYIFNRTYNGTKTAYSLVDSGVYGISKDFNISFYDGDGSGQIAAGESDPILREFGELFETESSHLRATLTLQSQVKDHARLFISNPLPYMSAVIYRPEVSLPSLERLIAGNIDTLPALTVDPKYFAAKNAVEGGELCSYFTSCQSPVFVENSRIAGDFVISAADYVFHAGSFEINKEVDFGFSLANAGATGGTLSAETFTGSPEIYLDPNHVSLNNSVISPSEVASTGTASGVISIPFKFLATTTGTYTKDYSITYTTGRANTFTTQTFVVRVVARAVSAPKVLASVSTYDADGNLLADKPAVETGINHAGSDEFILLEAVQVISRDPNGPAIKKRIFLKNDSAHIMTSLNIDFKPDPAGEDSSEEIGSNEFSTKVIKVSETNCPIGIASSFAPNEECYIDLWYQPLYTSGATSVYLTVLYDTSASGNQFVQENIGLKFKPLSPSKLYLVGAAEQNLRYRDREDSNILKSGQKGFVISSSNSVYDVQNKQFIFTRQLANDALDTRASLLRQFEKLNGLGNSNYSESDITFDVDDFVTVYDQDSVAVKANKICLFGGTNESSLSTNLLGFNANTVEQCNIKVIFKPGINIIGRSLSFTKVDDVSDYYFYLEYYNNKRDSYDKLFLTFSGKFEPPKSFPIDMQAYSSVDTFSGSEIRVTWSEMNPQSPILGDIVGYRVYYTKFPSQLGTAFDLIKSTSSYEDVYSGNSIILDSNYIQDLTSYYIQVVAIRENAAYTKGLFTGLSSGRYLSLTNEPKLKVTVPSADTFYNYEKNALISYDKLSGIHDFFQAQDACNNQNVYLISDNGATVLKRPKLIDQEVWDIIETDFSVTSNYGGVSPANIPHWLDEGLNFDIDVIFQSVVGYDSGSNYQRFEDYGLVYIRSSEETQESYGSKVAKTEGGIFNYANYDGFLTPTAKEGFARCFISLD